MAFTATSHFWVVNPNLIRRDHILKVQYVTLIKKKKKRSVFYIFVKTVIMWWHYNMRRSFQSVKKDWVPLPSLCEVTNQSQEDGLTAVNQACVHVAHILPLYLCFVKTVSTQQSLPWMLRRVSMATDDSG